MSARPPTSLSAQIRESVAVLTSLIEHEGILRAIADRLASCLEAGGTIYLAATGAVPPMHSTSPPSSSAGFCGSGGRCPPSL